MLDFVSRFMDHFTAQRKGTAQALAVSLIVGSVASALLKSLSRARHSRSAA